MSSAHFLSRLQVARGCRDSAGCCCVGKAGKTKEDPQRTEPAQVEGPHAMPGSDKAKESDKQLQKVRSARSQTGSGWAQGQYSERWTIWEILTDTLITSESSHSVGMTAHWIGHIYCCSTKSSEKTAHVLSSLETWVI